MITGRTVKIPTTSDTHIVGDLFVPDRASGLIIFAHGSGSSRHSPRNRVVAEMLQHAGLATLLVDLQTVNEEGSQQHDGRLRFNIDLLAERLPGPGAIDQAS